MGIVVTGVGLVSALGVGVEQNLASIRQGVSGIKSKPEYLRTTNEVPVGELSMSNEELHQRLSISPGEHLSRTALLAILAVREALEDAQVDLTRRVGLISSTSVAGMDLTEHFFEDFIEDESAGRLRDVRMHDCAATTQAIMRYCGIKGYSTTISTACSSGANAVIMGAKLLKHGIVDCVVVGGSDALSAFTLNGFKSLMILDQSPCRPFDATRAGLNLGEGAGYLVMQREEEAMKWYCRLAGSANRNDAYHQTASSVEGDGAYLAMAEALASAGLSPEDVDYINVHGTGTMNNDAAESAAMLRLFADAVPAFSSTKAFTGHTLAAAGGVEAVLSVMALHRGILYPNMNFREPIEPYGLVPVVEFTQGRDLRCVVSNSFGFGGNCSSLVFTR
ncbi:MAG: beta-ketoacyl-[acyl-carrier-protein] synthase family protein [Alistipes sp.]|nr:beta-ketoacyl-[acyl-carrier-protein] synthase family protein [Alistipes sp.]